MKKLIKVLITIVIFYCLATSATVIKSVNAQQVRAMTEQPVLVLKVVNATNYPFFATHHFVNGQPIQFPNRIEPLGMKDANQTYTFRLAEGKLRGFVNFAVKNAGIAVRLDFENHQVNVIRYFNPQMKLLHLKLAGVGCTSGSSCVWTVPATSRHLVAASVKSSVAPSAKKTATVPEAKSEVVIHAVLMQEQ